MSTAVLRVTRAGPLVSLQDAGRPHLMRFGVPASGPMDTFAHAVANIVLERPPSQTAVEVSLGGLAVVCESAPLTVAVCGGGFTIDHSGESCDPWCVRTLLPGDTLTLTSGTWGNWCYLAVAGNVRARRWLDSTATHVRSGLGGGLVRAGDELCVESAQSDASLDGAVEQPAYARPLRDLRVVAGPQIECFAPGCIDTLTAGSYVLTGAYDRMGVRLDGPTLAIGDALGIASTPIVRGSLQVAGDGVPTMLFADHQTSGGYPKIATVISGDAARAAQLRAGDAVRFIAVEPGEAVAAARRGAAARAEALAAVDDRPSLRSRRLLGTNLIGGAFHHPPVG